MKFYIAAVSFFWHKCRYCRKLFSEVPVRSTGAYRQTLSPVSGTFLTFLYGACIQLYLLQKVQSVQNAAERLHWNPAVRTHHLSPTKVALASCELVKGQSSSSHALFSSRWLDRHRRT